MDDASQQQAELGHEQWCRQFDTEYRIQRLEAQLPATAKLRRLLAAEKAVNQLTEKVNHEISCENDFGF